MDIRLKIYYIETFCVFIISLGFLFHWFSFIFNFKGSSILLPIFASSFYNLKSFYAGSRTCMIIIIPLICLCISYLFYFLFVGFYDGPTSKICAIIQLSIYIMDLFVQFIWIYIQPSTIQTTDSSAENMNLNLNVNVDIP